MKTITAESPKAHDGREYHIGTLSGDIAHYCILVGDPARAEMIAETFFENPRLVGDHRGLKSYTGMYKKIPVSVVTTGMGSPSMCIVLPEAYHSGARVFIRVGTCGALREEARLGDIIVVELALRLEGTSKNYADSHVPALPDKYVLKALVRSAGRCAAERHFVGIEATTDCFREGQGRPNTDGILTERARKIHARVHREGAMCYSMEASALFIWCATHHGGIPCGAVNAVIANRVTGAWGVKGEKRAARVALEAIRILAKNKTD